MDSNTENAIRSLIERLSVLNQRELTEEECEQVELWQKGKVLAQLVSFTDGWQIIREMLQSYAQKATAVLLDTPVGNAEGVKAAHATAFCANEIYTNFVRDVERAIQMARETPDIVKTSYQKLPVANL